MEDDRFICYDPSKVHKYTDNNIEVYIGKYGYFGENEDELISQFIQSLPIKKCVKLVKVDNIHYFQSENTIAYPYFYEMDEIYVKEYKKDKLAKEYYNVFSKYIKTSFDSLEDAGLMNSTMKVIKNVSENIVKKTFGKSEDGYEKTNGDKF